MLFLLPLVATFCLSSEYKKGNIKNLFSITLFGLLAGIVYSFFDFVFTSNYFLVKYSFFSNFFHYSFIEMFFPIILVVAVYVFFTKNYRDMFKGLFYLFIAFFSIYLPFRIISENQNLHYYLLFFKPVLFLCALFYMRFFVFVLYEKTEKEGFTVKTIAPGLVSMIFLLLVPSAIETVWLIGLSPLVWVLLSLIYVAGLLICFKFKYTLK